MVAPNSACRARRILFGGKPPASRSKCPTATTMSARTPLHPRRARSRDHGAAGSGAVRHRRDHQFCSTKRCRSSATCRATTSRCRSRRRPPRSNWSQIASIDGRLNDAFINKEDRKVPARQHPRCDLSLDVRLRPAFGAVRDRADRCRTWWKPASCSAPPRRKTSCTARSRIWKTCFRSAWKNKVRVKAVVLDAFPAESRQAPADPPRDGLSSSQRDMCRD